MEETIQTFRRKLKEYDTQLDEDEEKSLRLQIQKILNDFLKEKIE